MLLKSNTKLIWGEKRTRKKFVMEDDRFLDPDVHLKCNQK